MDAVEDGHSNRVQDRREVGRQIAASDRDEFAPVVVGEVPEKVLCFLTVGPDGQGKDGKIPPVRNPLKSAFELKTSVRNCGFAVRHEE